mgnify:CR=1 FL=1
MEKGQLLFLTILYYQWAVTIRVELQIVLRKKAYISPYARARIQESVIECFLIL